MIPRILEPTDLPIVVEATAQQIIDRWAAGQTLTLVGWAKDGNDGKKTSRQLQFKTPQPP